MKKQAQVFLLKGKLQVKNTTKEISIPFTFKKSGAKGTFNAKFSIDRTVYGVGKASNDVGNTITIEAKIPVTKK